MRKILLVFMLLLSSSLTFINLSAATTENEPIVWTTEEAAFLADHPEISVGIDTESAPFEFIENDQYKGLTADYLEIIAEKTGIEFQIVYNDTWEETYNQAVAGDIDMLSAVSKSHEREEIFLFSEMYYELRRVIVVMESNTDIHGIEDLYGKTVAVHAGSSHYDFLLDYPEITISSYSTVLAAITDVYQGYAVAYIGNLATSDYLIKSHGISGLRYVNLEEENPAGLYFAFHQDWTVFAGIIDKVLLSISAEEKIQINSRWMTIDYTTDYGPLLKAIGIASAILLLGGLLSFFWNIKLKKEIDIRKRTQVELERSKQEAIEANNIKSSFLARMSHEIRTPLNAISGMAYLLKETDVSTTQMMYAERITQASDTMLGIVNDILDYSKIEAGKASIDLISFNLDHIIQNIISIISVKITEKKLRFRFHKDPGIPVWLEGDCKHFQQILINILTNAVKFTETGEVSLTITEKARNDSIITLRFSVKDTGIGMSKATLENLFTPFTQADSSITRRFGGTGLGLSIARNLAEAMDGKIEVESLESAGTLFTVTLPFTIDIAKNKETKTEKSEQYLKKLNVLMLLAAKSDMDIMESYLTSFGIEATSTISPEEATHLVVNEPGKYDLLIIDYEAPSGHGFSYLKQLRETVKISEFPKVIMLLPMSRSDLYNHLEVNFVNLGIGKPVIPSVLYNGIVDIFINSQIKEKGKQFKNDLKLESTGYAKPLVLVVEDNQTNQMIARLLLEKSGYLVVSAENGREGVAAYAANRDLIRLVLMDLHMPVMDGFSAAKLIKQEDPDIPIVAMTAEVIPGVREKCEANGIDHYISKPFDPEKFIETVNNILGISNFSKAKKALHINKEKGLKLTGNNEDLYQLILKTYREENIDTGQRLREVIAKQDYSAARQILHKIKGSTGSIGADKLFQIITDLQKAIIDNDEVMITDLSTLFADAIQVVLAEIAENTSK